MLQDNEDDGSDDDNSDDDIDDTMAAVSISQGTAKHKLQFLVSTKLPLANVPRTVLKQKFRAH